MAAVTGASPARLAPHPGQGATRAHPLVVLKLLARAPTAATRRPSRGLSQFTEENAS